MGYSTDFIGDLYITVKMTDDMWEKLESYFGEDVRNHEYWDTPQDKYGPAFYYINIKPNDDRNGIEWDGSEKTYGMTETIQFLISEMRKDYPNFGLVGVMEAQGEDVSDHWFLIADGDKTFKVDARDFYVNYEERIKTACKTIVDNSSGIEATIS